MKRAIWIIVVIIAAGAAAISRSNRTDEVDAKVAAAQSKLAEIARSSAGFDKHRAFYEQGADAAHEHALRLAITPGARRRPPTFDPVKYAGAFADALIMRAKVHKSGDHELSTFLRQLQIDLEAAAGRGALD